MRRGVPGGLRRRDWGGGVSVPVTVNRNNQQRLTPAIPQRKTFPTGYANRLAWGSAHAQASRGLASEEPFKRY